MGRKKQYGVIPYIEENNEKRLVLITSRTNGYWIFPKGNPIKNKSHQESAAQEAFEEAGILGTVSQTKSYKFSFTNHGTVHEVVLYPMKVTKILTQWQEDTERKRRIVSSSEALKYLQLEGFLSCLEEWGKDFL